jgi:hypothetical protein
VNKHDGEENEIKEIEVNTIEISPTPDIAFQEDIENLSKVKEIKHKIKLRNILNFIERHNAAITLLFSLTLIVVSVAQYITYNRQANIASNANKLSQYEYRFEFYKKLESLQKATSFVMKDPKQSVEEFPELHFKIISLLRESELLFNKDISQKINDILNEHLDFLVFIDNNENINHDNYKKELFRLNTAYGNFLNSDSFKVYLDINRIE